jgi:hypothetical protein
MEHHQSDSFCIFNTAIPLRSASPGRQPKLCHQYHSQWFSKLSNQPLGYGNQAVVIGVGGRLDERC